MTTFGLAGRRRFYGKWYRRPVRCIGLNQQEQGVLPVKGNIEERAVELAQYIIENRTTVRAAAAKFGISKSTVHMVIY